MIRPCHATMFYPHSCSVLLLQKLRFQISCYIVIESSKKSGKATVDVISRYNYHARGGSWFVSFPGMYSVSRKPFKDCPRWYASSSSHDFTKQTYIKLPILAASITVLMCAYYDVRHMVIYRVSEQIPRDYVQLSQPSGWIISSSKYLTHLHC